MQIYDFAVIGAGPAGSNFARLAAKSGLSILVINGQSESHRKPCGGLLAPDAQVALAEMDLTLPASVMVDPQIFAVKTVDLRQGLVRYYPRRYLNIDRFAFDSWLCSLIPETADLISGLCLDIRRDDKKFSLDVRTSDGKVTNFFANGIVGADGANSLVRRLFYGGYREKKAIKRYIAIQQWFQSEKEIPLYACIFDKETSPAYSFSVSKNGKMLFGGIFEPKDCRKAFEEQKKQLTEKKLYQNSFKNPITTEACMVCRPRRQRDFITGRDSIYLIGEAAGFISPSSFEGISYALYSARALALAICDAKEPSKIDDLYRRNTFSLRSKLLGKCVKRTVMYRPVLRRMALRSGLLALRKNPKEDLD